MSGVPLSATSINSSDGYWDIDVSNRNSVRNGSNMTAYPLFQSTFLYRIFNLLRDFFSKTPFTIFVFIYLVYTIVNSMLFYHRSGGGEVIILNILQAIVDIWLIRIARTGFSLLKEVFLSITEPSGYMQKKTRVWMSLTTLASFILLLVNLAEDLAISSELTVFFEKKWHIQDHSLAVVCTTLYLVFSVIVYTIVVGALCLYITIILAHGLQLDHFSFLLQGGHDNNDATEYHMFSSFFDFPNNENHEEEEATKNPLQVGFLSTSAGLSSSSSMETKEKDIQTHFESPDDAANTLLSIRYSIFKTSRVYQNCITSFLILALIFFVDFSLHTIIQLKISKSSLISLTSYWSNALYFFITFFFVLIPGAITTSKADDIQRISTNLLVERHPIVDHWFLMFVNSAQRDFGVTLWGIRITSGFVTGLLLIALPLISIILRIVFSAGTPEDIL